MSRAIKVTSNVCPYCKGQVATTIRGNRPKGTEYAITKRGLKQWLYKSCYLEECKRRKALRDATTAR